MTQLRPYNQSQVGLAYRRKSWGLGDITDIADLPMTPVVAPDMIAGAMAADNLKYLTSVAFTPSPNAMPSGTVSGVMWIAIAVIVAMGLGVFDEPRRYGR